MIPVFFLYAFLASSYMCSKTLLDCISPMLLTAITSLGAGALLLSAYIYHKRTTCVPHFSQFLKDMTIVALCTTFGATVLRYYALSCVSAFFVTLVMVFDPFITAMLSYFLQGIPCNIYQIGAICLAVSGTLPLLTSELSVSGSLQLIPLAALFVALVINRMGWIHAQKVLKQDHYSPTLVTATNMIIGGLLSGVFAIPNNYHLQVLTLTSSQVCKIMYVLTINNVLCSWGYTYLLSKFSITLLSITEFLTPCFVALLGWLLWSDPIDWKLVVALICVSLGLFLFMKFQRRETPVNVN